MGVLIFIASSCAKEDGNTNEQQNFPVLSTSEVTEITQSTATSGGNITNDGGTTVTARGVCWSTHENPTVDGNKTEDGKGAGSFTSRVSGLELNTIYYLRAYATNSTGTGYGSTMSFTALQGFTDFRDGTVYRTATIGGQEWMAENLKYLPYVIGPGTGSQTTPFYYVYDYDGTNVTDAKATANYSTYGVLYNWEAAKAACPTGWHLPSDAEWEQLTDYLGGWDVAGGKLKEAGTTHWSSPNEGATNETGFTALPGGTHEDGTFWNIGIWGVWWSDTKKDDVSAFSRLLFNNYAGSSPYPASTEAGLSVRCLRD